MDLRFARPSMRQQLWAILKRNLIIKKRAAKQTMQEMVFPLVFLCVLMVIPNEISIFNPTKNLPDSPFGQQPIPFIQSGQVGI